MARKKDLESGFERMRRTRPSRSVLRTITDLTPTARAAAAYERRTGEPAPEFREPGLQELYDRGIISTIVRQLKSGKEATVYVAKNGDASGDASGDVSSDASVAVKLYHDIATRGFRNDAIYRSGRFVGDARLERAMAQGSRRGLAARQALWVEHEYGELLELHAAGVNVPRPLGHAGRAIAMEFIGEGDEPAPRLSEIRLSAAEARDAFDQAVENLAAIVAAGRVHGDYSAFNLLWWRGRVVVIDLPQLIRIEESRHAAELLGRDIDSLCATFARLDLSVDRRHVTRRVVRLEGDALRSSPLRELLR